MGSVDQSYSVPGEAAKILKRGLADNSLIDLPGDIAAHVENVSFEGSALPSIAVNWRFAESIAALKGLEAATVNLLLEKKEGRKPSRVTINTDHAQLFIMSAVLYTVDPQGEKLTAADTSAIGANASKMAKYFPNCDIHGANSSPHRSAATNIYRTKDGRYYHLHGSMNPDTTLDNIGLPHDVHTASLEEAWPAFFQAMGVFDAAEIDRRSNDEYKTPGVICLSVPEYINSEHGKANSKTGLYEIQHHSNSAQLAGWWTPQDAELSSSRPLSGLKVLDLTRVIAGPSLTRGLAELGASVMRISSPKIPDMSPLHPDLNFGKWNASLDLTQKEGKVAMRELIEGADIIVDGYRPGVMDRLGFGRDEVLGMCRQRKRGIVYVRENCYGWHGPWSSRSGWQQISDACTGVSMEFGRAMGLEEPVTPVFPNSDYCTGVAGVVGVLRALMLQAEAGGSYTVDIALNYYNNWLIDSVGTYPASIWEDLWTRIAGKQVFRHYHGMLYTLPRYLGMLFRNANSVLFRDDFFETRHSGALGVGVRTVKPIARWEDDGVCPGYTIGTRGNGVDKARWPEDLSVEIVV